MILRNYYKAMSTNNFGLYNVDVLPVSMAGTVINTNSVNCKLADSSSYSAPYMGRVNTAAFNYQKTGIIIGSGSTAATFDDYKLENRIIADTTTTVTLTKGADEEGSYISSDIVITNNTGEAFTVAECGVHAAISSSTSESTYVLLDRTVLDSPVTVPAGEVGRITYTIRMNYPT